MSGHMGHERVTMRSLDVVRIDAEKNLCSSRARCPGRTRGGRQASRRTVCTKPRPPRPRRSRANIPSPRRRPSRRIPAWTTPRGPEHRRGLAGSGALGEPKPAGTTQASASRGCVPGGRQPSRCRATAPGWNRWGLPGPAAPAGTTGDSRPPARRDPERGGRPPPGVGRGKTHGCPRLQHEGRAGRQHVDRRGRPRREDQPRTHQAGVRPLPREPPPGLGPDEEPRGEVSGSGCQDVPAEGHGRARHGDKRPRSSAAAAFAFAVRSAARGLPPRHAQEDAAQGEPQRAARQAARQRGPGGRQIEMAAPRRPRTSSTCSAPSRSTSPRCSRSRPTPRSRATPAERPQHRGRDAGPGRPAHLLRDAQQPLPGDRARTSSRPGSRAPPRRPTSRRSSSPKGKGVSASARPASPARSVGTPSSRPPAPGRPASSGGEGGGLTHDAIDPIYIVKKPVLTEKSTEAMNEHGRYTFEVDRRATKTDIKDAIESSTASASRASRPAPRRASSSGSATAMSARSSRRPRRSAQGRPGHRALLSRDRPEAGPANRARAPVRDDDHRNQTMAIRVYKPTSNGRRNASVNLHTEVTKKEPERSLLVPIKNRRAEPQGRHHRPRAWRRRQAPLPQDRLPPARPRRDQGHRRRDRVRPQPLVPHRADPVRGRRQAVHPRPVGLKDGMTVLSSSTAPIEPEPATACRCGTSRWA
jgi:hypothetical protein